MAGRHCASQRQTTWTAMRKTNKSRSPIDKQYTVHDSDPGTRTSRVLRATTASWHSSPEVDSNGLFAELAGRIAIAGATPVNTAAGRQGTVALSDEYGLLLSIKVDSN